MCVFLVVKSPFWNLSCIQPFFFCTVFSVLLPLLPVLSERVLFLSVRALTLPFQYPFSHLCFLPSPFAPRSSKLPAMFPFSFRLLATSTSLLPPCFEQFLSVPRKDPQVLSVRSPDLTTFCHRFSSSFSFWSFPTPFSLPFFFLSDRVSYPPTLSRSSEKTFPSVPSRRPFFGGRHRPFFEEVFVCFPSRSQRPSTAAVTVLIEGTFVFLFPEFFSL